MSRRKRMMESLDEDIREHIARETQDNIERGMPPEGLEPADFTDPSARALVHRITALLRAEARDDWRPDVLELAEEPWLEGPIARVRTFLEDVRRLTDAQIEAETQRVSRQLRASRLAVEISESVILLEEAEDDEVARIGVQAVTLYRSHLSSQGSTYEALTRARLVS